MDTGGGHGGVVLGPEKMNTPDGEPRGKRKMKTPSQLEILERTYAVETHPSEALRADLSVQLGLTDRQLQMWFCHRRLKDRKAPLEKTQKKNVSLSAAAAGSSGGTVNEMAVTNADVAKGNGLGLSLYGNTDPQHKQQKRAGHKVGTAVPRISMEPPSVRRFYEPPLAIYEQRAIKFVEAQLGEPLREDGPILGMEFDTLPPGVFGAPIATSEQKGPAGRSYDPQLYERHDAKTIKGASRSIHEYQFLTEKPSVRHDAFEREVSPHCYGLPSDPMNAPVPLPTVKCTTHSNDRISSEYLQSKMADVYLSPASREVDVAPPTASMLNSSIDSHLLVDPITGLPSMIITPERRIILDQERLERKQKIEEARIAKEVEAHEKMIRKELEKQDILRKKREEQMRKDMERQDRERRKEEERLLREKQRDEEKYQREQRRETERREKFLQKEYIRAEKMRLKDEMRREKEAARLRTANDRAAARRIAKESTELIDDERLELMELAALSKGLPSVLALDSETLQNLSLFRDKLQEFPPESVHLKRPFSVQPWIDSEDNVGNLLMVWRFLIAFADVLGLWPFTLDEFAQVLHDCDPRLLGEIHIALLRFIIKDIEDVARTPASAMAANQNSSGFSPVGGHPHIVQGAYDWGFDLLSWQRLLTPLTWPEVLRRFALSAGFGPKLKKPNMKSAHLDDENEGNDNANTISNLRSRVAAENAVAIMQERGLSNPRKSRHRLTPGTVKYAAFHILSLEGSKGLSILEVSDKIQRSGLRDLTTSKTPEASISAALSRDTKLFERTAPSTYCVRSPYRKDPSNAEEILSEARDKTRVFLNGGADDADKEDLERDQDSESDDPNDPEVDYLDLSMSKVCPGETSLNNALENSEVSKGDTDVASCVETTAINDLENSVSDECGSGEPWIEGLTEGEYADLSTEERLDALVALIGVANEGNGIRIAMEERLEAANALKKQMLAEAQLDKRRTKEEHISKVHHHWKNESSSSTNPMFHLVDLNDQQNEENYCNINIAEKNPLVHEYIVGSDNILLQQCAERSRSQLKALIGHRAEEIYVYRSLPLGQDRRRNRYWQFMASPSRNDPGSGKIYVELCGSVWRFIDSEEGFNALLSSLDIRGTREYHLHSMLLNIGPSFKKAARKNLLPSNSDSKKRDSETRQKLGLHCGVGSPKSILRASCSNSPGSSISFNIDLENNRTDENDILRRYTDFDWLWKECFNSNVLSALRFGTLRRQRLLEICTCCHGLFSWEDYHCPSCHKTCNASEITFDFSEHISQCEKKRSEGIPLNLSLPPRIRVLKTQLALIEASLPSEAFKSVWSDEYRKSWGRNLHTASTAGELLQTLTLLEDSIKREFLSATYEPTSEMLSSCDVVGSRVGIFSGPEVISVLPWIPLTTPAVALRLMELDVSVYYTPDQETAHKKEHESGYFIKFPSLNSGLGSSTDKCNTPQAGYLQQDNCLADMGNGRAALKRGRGRPRGPSRTCGGKSQRTTKDKSSQLPRWKGRSRAHGDTAKKGRRSVTNMQNNSTLREAVGNVVEKRGVEHKMVYFNDAAVVLGQEDWNLADNGENDASSSERSEYEYDDVDNSNIHSKNNEFYDEVSLEGFKKYEPDREDEDDDDDERMAGQGGYYDEGYINSHYNEGIRSDGEEDAGKVDGSFNGGSEPSSSSEFDY